MTVLLTISIFSKIYFLLIFYAHFASSSIIYSLEALGFLFTCKNSDTILPSCRGLLFKH